MAFGEELGRLSLHFVKITLQSPYCREGTVVATPIQRFRAGKFGASRLFSLAIIDMPLLNAVPPFRSRK